MKPYTIRLLIVVLLFLTVLLFIPSIENFENVTISPEMLEFITKTKAPENMPDPKKILKSLRSLMDKYEQGEFIDHAKKVHTMDPGQLARMELGILN